MYNSINVVQMNVRLGTFRIGTQLYGKKARIRCSSAVVRGETSSCARKSCLPPDSNALPSAIPPPQKDNLQLDRETADQVVPLGLNDIREVPRLSQLESSASLSNTLPTLPCQDLLVS